MQLSFDKIKQITRGAAFTEVKDGKMYFNRFSKPQLKAYREQTRSADFVKKSLAASGVRFEFTTNSKTLSFSGKAFIGSSRKFFYFDVYVNNALCAHFGAEKTDEHEFDYSVELGEGYKDVRVYFPWSASVELSAVEVDDKSCVAPMPSKPKMICFGDSITQGIGVGENKYTFWNAVTSKKNRKTNRAKYKKNKRRSRLYSRIRCN